MGFDPNEPRDNQGKWTDAGGGSDIDRSIEAQKAMHEGAARYRAVKRAEKRQREANLKAWDEYNKTHGPIIQIDHAAIHARVQEQIRKALAQKK